MFDPAASMKLASACTELALANARLQMSMATMGSQIALRSMRAASEPRFVPKAPAVWSPSRTNLPPIAAASIAFWQGWFQTADAMQRQLANTSPVWPAFASGSAGSGHAGQLMGELPRIHVAFQPGVHSPFWPWKSPGMMLLAVTLPPALEAMMTGWAKGPFTAWA